MVFGGLFQPGLLQDFVIPTPQGTWEAGGAAAGLCRPRWEQGHPWGARLHPRAHLGPSCVPGAGAYLQRSLRVRSPQR